MAICEGCLKEGCNCEPSAHTSGPRDAMWTEEEIAKFNAAKMPPIQPNKINHTQTIKKCRCGTETTNDDGVCSDCYTDGGKRADERACKVCGTTTARVHSTLLLCFECLDKEVGPNRHTDPVNSPSHYADHYPVEVRVMIKAVLDVIDEDGSRDPLSSWEAYCLGNELKYRLRVGFKGDAAEDIAKAMKYNEFRRGK